MQTLLFKRGKSANLGSLGLQAGEPAFVLDTGKFIIGNGTNKVVINPDLGNASTKNIGTAAGNIPILGADGKLDTNVVPAIAISDTFLVNTQAAMLALSAQVGDVAVRSDLSKSFILKVNDPTKIDNWQELLTPVSPVQSVNGKTGTVILTKADLGLGNVDNQSKATMFTSPAFTGTPTAPTASTATNNTQIATTSFVKSQGYLTGSSQIDGGTF
ncbi:hypothetical protein [Clostridium tyrobutyricum]|uniref:hyaluronate lyase N-terminal domain-containing protein n=1 Tax=Clostridium tyrobutyricum TaxID=1519 RepID=UPI001C3821F7|nr:hypothetical protein [Clostridium tyrobutyricum]MBV4417114.1 hypothetical protein [Clostridium tyrobutyricum]MBV4423161.1 hypothetical protein [Clostridium tyrobutyricum]